MPVDAPVRVPGDGRWRPFGGMAPGPADPVGWSGETGEAVALSGDDRRRLEALGYVVENQWLGNVLHDGDRLRMVFNLQNWVIPAIVSSLLFGACHSYQGWPGFIAISIYGLLFALLYIRTASIWPCVIAHSLIDIGALFFPQ